jgi:hypothetical protein
LFSIFFEHSTRARMWYSIPMVTHHTRLITHAPNLFDAERCKHCAVIVSWCSSCRIAFSMLLSYGVLLIATRGASPRAARALVRNRIRGVHRLPRHDVFFYQWEAPVRNATVCGRPCSSWLT